MEEREIENKGTRRFWKEAGRWALDILIIAVASVLYSIGVNMFTSPNNIAPGGVTGIAIIVSSLVPVSVGTIYAGINLPLVILGFFLLNKRTMIKTLISVVIITIMTDYVLKDLPAYLAEQGNGILAAIFGGLLMGLGIGLTYMREATTGGTDIINKIINRFRPTLKLGQIQLITDGIIVAAGFCVYRDLNIVMYTLISLFVTSKVVDMLVYGGQECKFLMVFSERYEEISEHLVRENFGVSLIKAEGAYSGRERPIVAAAVHKADYIRVRRIVRQTDPRAFVIITGASEVLGEGFQKLE